MPALVPTECLSALPVSTDPIDNLLGLWWSQFADATRRSYAQALEQFAIFVGEDSVQAAVARLLAGKKGSAIAIVLAWRSALVDEGKAPATVNLRLAAIQSLIRQAYDLDLIPWTVHVRSFKTRAFKDTAGPGLHNVRRIAKSIQASGNVPLRVRNMAILHLLFDMGLRVSEVVSLNIEHVDLESGKLWVFGKGQHERHPLTMPPSTKSYLVRWLHYHGKEVFVGPLFVRLTNNGRGRRISRQTVFRLVKETGGKLGLNTSPHGIRHTSITEAVRSDGLLGGQMFARHANPQTTQLYVDNLEDAAGRVACMVASKLRA